MYGALCVHLLLMLFHVVYFTRIGVPLANGGRQTHVIRIERARKRNARVFCLFQIVNCAIELAPKKRYFHRWHFSAESTKCQRCFISPEMLCIGVLILLLIQKELDREQQTQNNAEAVQRLVVLLFFAFSGV